MFPFSFGAKKTGGTGFSVLTAREIKQEPKNERGEGCFTCAIFFAPSLTLVPHSLLLNRTETLATQVISTCKHIQRHCARSCEKSRELFP